MQHQALDLQHSHLPVSLLGYASQLQGTDWISVRNSAHRLGSVTAEDPPKEVGERWLLSGGGPRRPSARTGSLNANCCPHFSLPERQAFCSLRSSNLHCWWDNIGWWPRAHQRAQNPCMLTFPLHETCSPARAWATAGLDHNSGSNSVPPKWAPTRDLRMWL